MKSPMKYIYSALATAALSVGIGHAATVDLTDNSFVNVEYITFVQGPFGPINAFTEAADGVLFSFEALNNGQFRNVGPWGDGRFASGSYALSFGGGGGNTAAFSLTASADVTLTGFWGFAQIFNTGAIFDVTGGSTGNAFSTDGSLSTGVPVLNAFNGGPLSLVANQTYFFTTTNNSFSTLSHLTGLEFTRVSAPVPLPAGGVLLLGGLAALCVARRRRRAA